MSRKYIKVCVFGLISITQFMQCTILSREVHMHSSAAYQGVLRKSIEAAGQLQQVFQKLCFIEFDCLFKQGRHGLENAIKGYPIKHLGCSTTFVDVHCNDGASTGYFTISGGGIKALYLKDGCVPLDHQYDKADVEHIDQRLLETIRDSLYDPKGFKELMIDFLQTNYKVAVYASIEYPYFIPIVLEYVIGLTKEQLRNVHIIFNGYDVQSVYRKYYQHIWWAERLTGVEKNREGYGLVVSSLKHQYVDLSSPIDYILCIGLKPEYGDASLGTFSSLRKFEEKRFILVQQAKANGWSLIKLNNAICRLVEALGLSVRLSVRLSDKRDWL